MIRAAGLMAATLDLAVPLLVEELRRGDGPTEEDFAWARGVAVELGAKGDVLQFGGRGAGGVFNNMARAIAMLSFCPGGITFLGAHWESAARTVRV